MLIEVRSWASFTEHDEVDLSRLWEKAIVQLAVTQANERDDNVEAPNFDDDQALFAEVCAGTKPLWWPKTLDRILIFISVTPVGATTEKLGPSPVDPNGRELSKKVFTTSVLNLLESSGASFDGEVKIRLLRASNRQVILGWTGEAFIGEKVRRGRKGSKDSSSESSDTVDYLTEQVERRDQMILSMAQANNANLHGAAAVIQATRGVNAAPPWMREGEDASNMPAWMAMAQGVIPIITAALQGKPTATAIKEAMSQPVPHPMLGGMGAPQLPGPTQNQVQNYGEDPYLEEGDYDGYRVADDDLLDDEFADGDEYEDGEYEEEEEEEEEDDDDEDEEPRRRRRKKDRKKKEGKNPLEGASAEQIERWMNQMIDEHPERKGDMMKVGTRLASKLMGG